MRPRDTRMDLHLGRYPFELDAILAVPFQRVMPLFEHDSADLSEEIEVPVIAPKLAVSDAFKADIFLQLDDLRMLSSSISRKRSAVMFLRSRCMRACCNLAGRSRLPT